MGFHITHELVLGKNSAPVGIRLFLSDSDTSTFSFNDLLTKVTEQWLFGEKALFVAFKNKDAIPEGLNELEIPAHMVIELPASMVFTDEGKAFIQSLTDKKISVCLSFDFDFEAGQVLAANVKTRFVGFDSLRFNPSKIQALCAKLSGIGIPLITGVETVQEFSNYSQTGVSGVSGWFFIKNKELPAKPINATQMNIVKLLNLVRNNAEIREIESALKQDVALSYKLLRYLNSASMGLSQEVQSFKHAVNLLGYSKLNRWLSLLLVTASKDPMAPALMYTSLARARFMELVGKKVINKADDLFITGAFSLLDVILGVKMEHALDSMLLPEPICCALLGLDSEYLKILELAKACESNDSNALDLLIKEIGVDDLFVANAFLEAQAFASQMQLS